MTNSSDSEFFDHYNTFCLARTAPTLKTDRIKHQAIIMDLTRASKPKTSISRSNEIKEPFVFQAFEDNNLTLFVQPKDPNTPMSGCLSFWRKLEHIR